MVDPPPRSLGAPADGQLAPECPRPQQVHHQQRHLGQDQPGHPRGQVGAGGQECRLQGTKPQDRC